MAIRLRLLKYFAGTKIQSSVIECDIFVWVNDGKKSAQAEPEACRKGLHSKLNTQSNAESCVL